MCSKAHHTEMAMFMDICVNPLWGRNILVSNQPLSVLLGYLALLLLLTVSLDIIISLQQPWLGRWKEMKVNHAKSNSSVILHLKLTHNRRQISHKREMMERQSQDSITYFTPHSLTCKQHWSSQDLEWNGTEPGIIYTLIFPDKTFREM